MWMSLVYRGLTGVIIAWWRGLRNNAQVLIRTSHSLLRNQRHRAIIVPVRMRANGNFGDKNLEWLHWVNKKCMMSPSDAIDLESPLLKCFKLCWASGFTRWTLTQPLTDLNHHCHCFVIMLLFPCFFSVWELPRNHKCDLPSQQNSGLAGGLCKLIWLGYMFIFKCPVVKIGMQWICKTYNRCKILEACKAKNHFRSATTSAMRESAVRLHLSFATPK